MSRRPHNLFAKLPLAAVGLFLIAVCASMPGFADPDIPLGAGALRSLETGIGAYRDGALEVAVETLSDALLQGDLPADRTAEALYYRGLAYRELGKPGQAISDLSRAMSLKNGLSTVQRKEALRNRAGAYLEAGLTDGSATAVDIGPQERVRVNVPAGRKPVPVEAVQAPEAGLSVPATSSIDVPAWETAAPSWGETSVVVAPK
jgi:hypothetical protein